MMEQYKIIEKELLDGVQLIYKFANGYGASVIKHKGSYGNEKGLWELAVLKFNKKGCIIEWSLCYDTSITDDVIGYVTNQEILVLLHKIKELKGERE